MTTMNKRGGYRCLLVLLLMMMMMMAGQGIARASEDLALIEAINAYRGEMQRCGVQVSEPLPPLSNALRVARGDGSLLQWLR